MDALVRWAKITGYDTIKTECLHSDSSTRNFYKSHGFIHTRDDTLALTRNSKPIRTSIYVYNYKV